MKKLFFIILSLLIIFSAAFVAKRPETSLMQAFFNKNGSELAQLGKMAEGNVIVIFEGNSSDEVINMQNEFNKREIQNYGVFLSAIDEMKKSPENFLSEDVYLNLKNKNYKKIRNDAFNRLLNPLESTILAPENDPYALLTDYVFEHINPKIQEPKEYEGKFYLKMDLNLKNVEKERPLRKKILEIETTAKQIEAQNGGNIYLTGGAYHSYKTAKNSSVEINLICAFAFLATLLLLNKYLNSTSAIFSIISSIIFGFVFGFSCATILFKQLHILTLVFSTSLIGISLDYSLHHFLSNDKQKLRKSLTISMITTVLAFFILYFSEVGILKQIAVFSSCGLIGVYLYTIFILPDLEIETEKFEMFNFKKIKAIIIALTLFVVITGFFHLKFSDNVKNLYSPKGKLLAAETVNMNVFTPEAYNFLILENDDIEQSLQEEEKIKKNFNLKPSDYLALSRFFPSISKQKENFKLVKNLYKNDLDNFSSFLDKKAIKALKGKENEYLTPPENLVNRFVIDNKYSVIILTKTLNSKDYTQINIQDETTSQLRALRKKILKGLPFGALFIIALIFAIFGPINGVEIILPPALGSSFAIGLLALFGVEINIFHLLAVILILGFSLDYSVFRASINSGLAVFISCASTSFSFLLLAFSGFKPVSSLGITLFIGIVTSYILSLVLVTEETENA